MAVKAMKKSLPLLLLPLAALPARALPQHGHDVFMGSGTPGPFTLSWKGITPGAETVLVNSVPQTRGVDYRLDPDAGTLTFTAPLPAQAAAEVTYEYDPAHAQRTTAGVTLPLSYSLAQTDQTSLSLNALYKGTAGATTPGALTLGLGGGWHGAGSAGLTTHFLFAPALSSSDASAAPDGLARTGLSITGATRSDRIAQFSFGFARAGVGLSDSGGDSSLKAGAQTLTLGAKLTPSKTVLADLSYAQNDSTDPHAPGARAQTALAVAVTPNSQLKVQTSLSQATATGKDAAQSAGLSVTAAPTQKVQIKTDLAQTSAGPGQTVDTVGVALNAQPTASAQVTASYALHNAAGKDNDTEAMNLAGTLAATRTVSLTASAGQSRQGTATVSQQSLSANFNPRPAFQFNTGLTLSQSDRWATTTASVGGTLRPASFLQVSAAYKDRVAPAADPNALDGLDTSTAQVALTPLKTVKLTGTYAQNPDDGTLQRLARRGLGLETTLGALSLTGGYDWSRQYGTPTVGTSLNVGVGLRLSAATQFTAGYKQDLTGLGVDPAGTTAYSIGFTHNLGDRFNVSLKGTVQQNLVATGATPVPNAYDASANLGVKF